MSTKDSESKEDYECPVDGCEYTNDSKRGTRLHFGQAHDEGVKHKAYLDELKRLADELGNSPTSGDMEAHGRFSITTYQNCFGSWNEALIEAELSPNLRRDIPTNELLSELKQLADELDRTPTIQDIISSGKFSDSIYKDRFGSWNAALTEAGFKPNQRVSVSDDTLLDELRRLASELGHPPTTDEMVSCGIFHHNVYHIRFGSWNEALTEAGLDPWVPPTGEDHHNWNGGLAPYGAGWSEAKKERVREKYDRICQGCGDHEAVNLEQYGCRLSVHHVFKARWFDDDDERNDESNLIPMCIECHPRWEGIPLKPQVVE